MAKNKEIAKIIKYRQLYLMILPSVVFFIVFCYAPMYGIILAFKKFMYSKGIWGSPWVGLENFKMMLKDNDFWVVFRNTLVISFGKLLTGFPAPIILALLLNELPAGSFKKFTQSILYLPHFLSWVIMAGLIYNLFSITNGVLPRLLSYLDIQMPRIIANPVYFRPLIYTTNVWKEAGWGTIIYLAAIAGIDPTIYESALIDGAGRFKRMIYITLPSLSYAIVVLLILNVGQVMNAGFDQIFNLYSAPVYPVGDIIDTYVYRIGVLNARYEYSTAVGLFKSVINCILLLSSDRIVKKMGYTGLYS